MDEFKPDDQLFENLEELQGHKKTTGPRLFASFWGRYFAFFYDSLITSIVFGILCIVIALLIGLGASALPFELLGIGGDIISGGAPILGIIIALFPFIFQVAYGTFFEGGRGATPGKVLLGIRVVDTKRHEIDSKIAFNRNILKFLPLYLPQFFIIISLFLFTLIPFLGFFAFVLTPLLVIAWIVIMLYSYMAMVIHKYYQNWYDSRAETLLLFEHDTQLRRGISIVVGIFLHLLCIFLIIYAYMNPPQEEIQPLGPTYQDPLNLESLTPEVDPIKIENDLNTGLAMETSSPSPSPLLDELPKKTEPKVVENLPIEDSTSVIDNLISSRTGGQPKEFQRKVIKPGDTKKQLLQKITANKASGRIAYGKIKESLYTGYVTKKSGSIYNIRFYNKKISAEDIFDRAYNYATPPQYPTLEIDVKFAGGNCSSIIKSRTRILIRETGLTADFKYSGSSAGIKLNCSSKTNRISGSISNSDKLTKQIMSKQKTIPVSWSVTLDQYIF